MEEVSRSKIKIIGKKRIQKFVLITSIHSMLMLTVLIMLVSSMGIWYLVQNYLAKVNNELYGIQKDSADIYISGVTDKLSNYITAMGVVSMSNDLRDNIFKKDVSRSEMVILSKDLGQRISEMTFFLYQSQEVIGQRLYTYLPADGYYFWDVGKVKEKNWFKELKEKNPQWWYTYSDVTHTYHLTLAGIINNYNSKSSAWGQDYCCQTITVDTGTLFAPYKGSYHSIYLFDNKSGRIIYSYIAAKQNDGALPQEKIEKLYNNIRAGQEFSQKIKIKNGEGNKENFNILTRNIGVIDATAVILFNPKQMEKSDGLGAIYSTVTLLIFMMLLLIISNRIYNKKLNVLIGKMDQFDEKEVQPFEPVGGADELARIERHLFRMQKRIQTLIQEEYTAKMQVMTAREQALMSCINPHFLYNTLNTISAMANLEGADSTTEMIAALSAMFRYSSEVTRHNVTLKDELSNISDYLYIQSIRYQNNFTYSVDIKEELYEYKVPKLILQPLIENAFKHGFKNQMAKDGDSREIRIWASKDKDDLVVSITDNGEGITAERLTMIQERMAEPVVQITALAANNNSIGLLNVHQRILLQYGVNYGLRITSEGEGKGVCVSVRVPCSKVL